MKLLLFLSLALSAQTVKINPQTGLIDLVGGSGGGGGTGAAPYDAAVAAQTTLTVTAATHGQGTAPIAMCFDGTTPFVASACSYTRATNGDIVFTWSPAFTGRVTIIGGGTGATGAAGATGATGPTGATGAATFTADARTTTSEALTSSDCGQAVTFSNGSAIAASLPASPLADGCVIAVKNIGVGDVTITPVSGTISGAASVTVSLGEMGWITSNGTNYEFLTTRMLGGSGISLTKSRISTTAAVDTGTMLSRATDQAGTDKYCRSTTSNDTYTCTLTPTLTAYTTGMCLVLNANAQNYGTASLNVDGRGATNIQLPGGLGLNDGDIPTDLPVQVCYNGSVFVLTGASPIARGRNGLECFEPFISPATTAGANGMCMMFSAVSGGTASSSSPEADAPGIQFVGTSTSSTATATVATDASVLFAAGVWNFTSRVRIPTLSTGSERFHAQTGFLDTSTATPVDGCYFRVKDDVNGGEWEAICRSNSTETAADTNVLPVANTWSIMSVTVNAAATSVEFRIDGAVVATITTNIPTGTGRSTAPRPLQITKTVGTTARTFEADWFSVRFVQTTPN